MKFSILFSTLSLFSACAVDGTEPDLGTELADPTGTTGAVARIALNQLTPAQLANASLNPAALTQANLNAMAATADGRAALTYAVNCALNSSQTVSATVGINVYQFQGGIGIASSWTTTALSTAGQRWVSSCVLSRLNYFGEKVTISMRGSLSALNVTPSESTTYTLQEGAFFGNVFAGANYYLAACNGTDQLLDDTVGDLPRRECAEQGSGGQTLCSGVAYAGACQSACTWSNGSYTGCQGPNGVTYNETVTAFVSAITQ